VSSSSSSSNNSGDFFAIKVPRLCRLRTERSSDDLPFPLDDDGFLHPFAAQQAASNPVEPGRLVDPTRAAASGSLVLLG
jgi:hypothetical protein